MKKQGQALLKVRQQWEGWAGIGAHLTVEEGVEKLRALGNTILEVDVPGRRAKIMHVDSDDDEVWVCDYCPAFSRVLETIQAHEATCKGRPQ